MRRSCAFLAAMCTLTLVVGLVAPDVPSLRVRSAYAATIVVNQLADVADPNTGDGVCDTGGQAGNQCSLRAAIQTAHTVPNSQIIVPAGIYVLTLGGIEIEQTMTITGADARTTVVDLNAHDGFRIEDSPPVYPVVSMSGLTIRNGLGGLGRGGAITMGAPNPAILSLTNVRLTGNRSDRGGAVNSTGDVTLQYMTIDGNSATTAGGGINIGAVGATVSIDNSTISGNTTQGAGGGIALTSEGTAANLSYTTVADNSATGGAGGLSSQGGAVTLKTSIIAFNTGGNCALVSGGSFTSQGHNTDSASSCNLTQTTDQINTNPSLASLQDAGGQTPTRPLNGGSAAIDSILLETCLAPNRDQRNVPRPLDGNGDGGSTCDRGAYERNPSAADLVVVFGDNPDPVLVWSQIS
jgi:CSLREA domain-containing protein